MHHCLSLALWKNPLQPFLQLYKSAWIPPDPCAPSSWMLSHCTHSKQALDTGSCCSGFSCLSWDLFSRDCKSTLTHLCNFPLPYKHFYHCTLHPGCCSHRMQEVDVRCSRTPRKEIFTLQSRSLPTMLKVFTFYEVTRPSVVAESCLKAWSAKLQTNSQICTGYFYSNLLSKTWL